MVPLFWRKFKITHFGQNCPKFGNIWLYQAQRTGFHKNFRQNFIYFFQNRKKKLFRAQKSTFCPYEHHYDYYPLRTLGKIMKFLKWRCFAFFSNKKFYSQIGLILTKHFKNRSFLASNGSKCGFLKLFPLIMPYFS